MNLDSIANSISIILLKQKVLILFTIVIVVVLAGGAIYNNTQKTNGTIYTVTSGPLEQHVLFSGTVVPKNRVTLSFERPGKVSILPFDVGDSVYAGELVAALDAATARAKQIRESSILESEQAILEELLKGSRKEDVAITQAQLQQSEATLDESIEGLIAGILNAFTIADTAMERSADILFDNPNSGNPKLKYASANRTTDILLEAERLQLGSVLKQWRADIQHIREWQSQTKLEQLLAKTPEVLRGLLGAAITASYSDEIDTPDFESLSQNARNHLIRFSFFFEDLSTHTGSLALTSGLTQATVDSYIANVSLDRSNIQTALNSLTAKREAYSSAQSAINVSEQKLALNNAGARAEAISSQRSKLNAQRAAVLSANVEIEKHSLFAPQTGVVTERFVEKGELVTTGAQALTLDTRGAFEIDARVSELDVVLLEEGMKAYVTTDAYGEDVTFQATLIRIDPAENITDGIAGYGVKLLLTEDASVLKAGMTANVSVKVILAEKALPVPIGFVERTTHGTFVHILKTGKIVRTEVTTGAETIDGRVDITSGLQEGDSIVPYEKAQN